MRDRVTLRFARLTPWLVLLLVTACAKPLPPNAVESGAFNLGTRPLESAIDCPSNDCVHWYRTEVTQRGTLSITLRELSILEPPAGFSVTMLASGGSAIANQSSMGRRELRIQRRVEPARYLIALHSDRPGRAFPYSIQAAFAPAPPPAPPPPPPPPEPIFEPHTSMILESEGWGQDVKAVLIESGEKHGIVPGMQGRLLNQGEEIGVVEVDQVYPDGSRLVVVGQLSAPVDPETVVEILIPVED